MLALSFALVMAACSASSSPDPNEVKGKFDIGGRSLYLECVGAGNPTVVMDAGLGNTHTTWQAVSPAASTLSRTCTYDRANRGSSDAAPKPRTSADVVADLYALLKAAAIPPPYVLVGHSFAGVTVRLFASTYPAEVVGIVLVDPTPTNFLEAECAIVDAALCDKLRFGFDPGQNPEGLDFRKSGAEVGTAGPLPDVPMVILSANNHKQPAITDPATEKQIEASWQKGELTLASSVPHGTVVVVESGHDIQLLHPEAVIAALKSVVAEARATP